MFSTDIKGILAVIAVLMCWSLAVVLFRISERSSVARMLAVLLIFEGFTLGTSTAMIFIFKAGLGMYELYPRFSHFQDMLHYFGDCMMIALYPPFLAAALKTRMTRPFARKGIRIGLFVYAGGLYLFAMFVSLETGVTLISLSLVLVFMFALIAAIQSWLSSKGQARTRARIFVLAFGIRDCCWAYIYAMQALTSQGIIEHDPSASMFVFYTLGTLLAVPLIAYGILRAHLFDIDLRIRWTLKQSTFGASVVIIVFGLSEGVEWLVSSELGDKWGLAAAAVVVFFLKPLQAFAERVVSVLMPNTQNTAEYKSSRKLEVYESAFAEARVDGISDKERALLVRLRDSLGISETDAESIELNLKNTSLA